MPAKSIDASDVFYTFVWAPAAAANPSKAARFVPPNERESLFGTASGASHKQHQSRHPTAWEEKLAPEFRDCV